ncbi:DUF6522 family protein [Acidimangrovimonas pyrenivorans]|uniref:DUF6522 family protein n=1 Tax=Acidimangrovimonas pyrenivorans TaxID=2030798 RepID=A0ABV7AEZ0_9RHOB
MERIAFADGRPQVQAEFPARALDLSTDTLRRGVRNGAITSRYKAGEGDHAGRIRLTFFAPERRLPTRIWSVGNYAIGIGFSGGHETGIYRFDALREIADCEVEDV